MPFLHLNTTEGLPSPSQKTALMERFTQALRAQRGAA